MLTYILIAQYFVVASTCQSTSTSGEKLFCDLVQAGDTHNLKSHLLTVTSVKLTEATVASWVYSDVKSFSMVLTKFPQFANARVYDNNVPAFFLLLSPVAYGHKGAEETFLMKCRMLALAGCNFDATAKRHHEPTGTPADRTLLSMMPGYSDRVSASFIRDFADIVELSRKG